MDFMNLAEVPEVDFVQDGDTIFVVRDGEVRRVAKDKVGGGAGNYVVNPASGEAFVDSDIFYVTTPVPGLLDAMRNGSTATVAADLGALVGESEIGVTACVTCLGGADVKAVFGEDAAGVPDGCVLSGIVLPGGYAVTMFTNGVVPTTTNLTTLRSKLGGGKSVKL